MNEPINWSGRERETIGAARERTRSAHAQKSEICTRGCLRRYEEFWPCLSCHFPRESWNSSALLGRPGAPIGQKPLLADGPISHEGTHPLVWRNFSRNRQIPWPDWRFQVWSADWARSPWVFTQGYFRATQPSSTSPSSSPCRLAMNIMLQGLELTADIATQASRPRSSPGSRRPRRA